MTTVLHLLSDASLPSPLVLDPRRLRLARQRKGFTQGALATAAGLSQSYISMAESGERNFSLEAALLIANALDVSVHFLCGVAEPGAPPLPADLSPRDQVLADALSPAGLIHLARDTGLCESLAISAEEWHALRSLDFGHGLRKEAYLGLLALLRTGAFLPGSPEA